MDLRQLKYFCDAAELENFSKAAKKNLIPQPSVSRAIHSLEDELGVRLFDRDGKKISLNSNGRYFYSKVKNALSTLDEATNHFNTSLNTNIVIYIQAGSRFISMLTADFLSSTSDVFISSINQLSDPKKQNYDFTFMQPLSDMSDFNYEILMEEEIVLVVSHDNPLSKYDELSIKQLSKYPFVGYYKTMNIRALTDSYCKIEGGFVPNMVFETSDNQALRYMIEKDRGIALMPEKSFCLLPDEPYKIIHLSEKTYRVLVIAWDKNKVLDVRAIHFLEYTKEWFKSL